MQSQEGVPAYQAGEWVRTSGPPGGLGYDIRYNYADHNLWYVTDAWAGIHMSTDRGLTWFTSNSGIDTPFGPAGDVIPVFSVTVDHHNPDIVWIGTQNMGHIFKSTDRGYTWTDMSNGIDPEIMPLSFRGITVDPRSSDIVYAMGEIGSIAWTPDHTERAGIELDLTMGIVYRTTDGGQNWAEIWRGNNLARYCWIDPRDPNIIYISTGIFDREAANTDVATGIAGGVGILKSTDGGATWRELNQSNGLLDLYIGSLYMHPENPDMLLAAGAQNNWSQYVEDIGVSEHTHGVYLTEDGGETWMRVLSERELYGVVEYCPSHPNVAYAASTEAVYRSEDAGHTWQRFSENNQWGAPGIPAGFPIDMQCDPDDPMRIFVNNYLGGNFLSTDGGQNWVAASTGYTGSLTHHVVIAPGDTSRVYVANRSAVFRTDNGGTDWIGLSYPIENRPGGKFNEITALAVDPTNPDHVLSSPNDLMTITVSYDGGYNWRGLELPGAMGAPSDIVFAPSDPSTVYASVGPENCLEEFPTAMGNPGCEFPGFGVYVSRDGGDSWNVPNGEQALGTATIALAVHPHDANTLYAAMPTEGVMKSTDGGVTWMPANNGLPNLVVVALTIDSANPDVVFAGLMGGGVFRSTDGGISWSQASFGMDAEGVVGSIAIDPTNSQIVYAASRFSGVLVSTDGGQSWHSISEGLAHRSANVVAISDDGTVLYVGMEGDGVYRLGTP